VDTIVFSTLGPRDTDARPAGALLNQALDCAARSDWASAYDVLRQAVENPAEKRCAHFMLWEVCQALRHPNLAIAHLRAVLQDHPVTSRHSAAPRRHILVLAVPGDFQANLPLGALLGATDTELHTLWLSDPEAVLRDPLSALPERLPQFDCVFIAIAEGSHHDRALAAADRLAAVLNVPVVNNGARIAAVSRSGAARLLQNLPDTVVPAQTLIGRSALARVADGFSADACPAFPMIVRPMASHAGKDLVRLNDAKSVRTYLDGVADELFYAAPFVDYRSADGLWRKYRVIFVHGRPLPYHLAIHNDWAIWYYNARMDLDPWKRLEEARFVQDIAAALPARALAALRVIGERVGLDYFGLDCGVLADGTLVVFEIETGMIVHDWDPPELYPYKPACAQSIARATAVMIDSVILHKVAKVLCPVGSVSD
jgi:glutathione synthase/RimK-type ligase-like ATP-grasp enzyme